MKKLAFEGVTSFEMPKMEKVSLEKENNIVFAGVSVYKPATDGTGFTQGQLRAYAQGEETLVKSNNNASVL